MARREYELVAACPTIIVPDGIHGARAEVLAASSASASFCGVDGRVHLREEGAEVLLPTVGEQSYSDIL